jgi:MFS family permease
VGLILAEMSVLAALTWTAPAFSRDFAVTPERVGAIVATALMISGALGPITGGVLADICQRRGGPRLTMAALTALALLGVPGGLFAIFPNILVSSALLVVFLTAVGAVIVTGIALFTIVVPNELRGLCVAVLAGAQVLFGVGMAPVLVSLLSGVLGGPALIGKALTIVLVATSTIAAAAFAFGRRYFPARAAS